MSFHNRQDAYRWSESHRPQGPCGLVIASGGFSHRYLLERDGDQLSLFYLGMATLQRPAHGSLFTLQSPPKQSYSFL